MLTRVVLWAAAVAFVVSCKKDEAKPNPGDMDAKAPPPALSDAAVATASPSDAAPASGDAGAVAATSIDAAPAVVTTSIDASPAGGGNTPDKDKPVNIKVLPKSWSKAKVDSYMKTQVAKGLGVDCDFCHDTNNFADDSKKHKLQTRQMIVLTRQANQTALGGGTKIKCATCHHGNEHPPK